MIGVAGGVGVVFGGDEDVADLAGDACAADLHVEALEDLELVVAEMEDRVAHVSRLAEDRVNLVDLFVR